MPVVEGTEAVKQDRKANLRFEMGEAARRRDRERQALDREVSRFTGQLRQYNQTQYATDKPEWRDTMTEIWADRVLEEPTSGLEIMSLKYLKDRDEDALRRYGDRLDPYYLNPDGTLNQQKLAEDDFVLEVEEAFYNHRGQIPLDWFVEHSEDLEFFGAEYREIIDDVYAQEQWMALEAQADVIKSAAMTRRIDTAVANQGWTAQRATVEYQLWVDMQQEIMREAEEWTDEEKRKYMIDRQSVGDRASNMLQDPFVDAEILPEAFEDQFLQQRGNDLLEARGYDLNYRELSETFGDRPTLGGAIANTVYDGLGGIASAFGIVADGIDFAAGALLPNALWNEHTASQHQEWMGSLFGDVAPSTQKENQAAALQHVAERDLNTTIREMSLFPAVDIWARLPEINPEAYDALLGQWGGDEDAARRAFLEDVAFAEEFRQQNVDHANRVKEEARVALVELENEDFGIGSALLDWMAVYGEGVETLATTILQGGKEIFGERNLGFAFQDEFWESVAEADTPAGVFGWEGTLTGLLINLVATEAVEPWNYAFGPRLASRGRQGVTTYDQALIQAAHPAARLRMEEAVKVARSMDGDAITLQTGLDVLDATGSDQAFLQATRGFVNPIVGELPWAGKEIAGVVDNVDHTLISGLIDEVDKAKAAKIAADPSTWEPVRLEVNPDTKALRVANPEQALAYQMKGIDAIPTVNVLDETIGLNKNARYQRLLAAGRVDEAFDLVDNVTARTGEAADEALVPKPDDHRLARESTPRIDAADAEILEFSDGAVTSRLRYSSDGTKHWLLSEDGQLVGVIDGTPGPKGDISLWVDPQFRFKKKGPYKQTADGRTVVDALFDQAKLHGDNYFEAVGSPGGGMISEAGEKNAVRQSQRAIDQGIVDMTPDPNAATRDWVGQYDVSMGGREIDGVVHVKPRRLMGEEIFGKVNMDEITDIYARHLADGGDPLHGRQTTMAVATGGAIRQAFRHNKGRIGSWIDNYMTPHMMNANLPFTGTVAMANLRQFQVRLWSTVEDLTSWEEWSRRMTEWKSHQATIQSAQKNLIAEARGVMDEIAGYDSWTAGKLDDGSTNFGAAAGDELIQARKNHNRVNAMTEEARQRYVEISKRQRKHNAELNNYGGLKTIMEEMMDDFNRKHLATRKDLAEFVDPETGLVDIQKAVGRPESVSDQMARVRDRAAQDGVGIKEAAQRELGMVPKEINELIELSGDASVNKFLEETVHVLNGPGSYIAPASPMELAALANGGTKAARTLRARANFLNMGQFMHDAHMMWTMDKVFSPRTAAVVSIDELMRAWQAGGNRAFLRYAEDKVARTAATVSRARRNPATWDKLPKRWKDRLVKLEQYPTFFRQMERTWLELGGVGFDVIEWRKGARNTEYLQAAQRSAGTYLNDVGFQKYMEGPDAFRKWFDEDPAAARVREQDYFDAGTGGRAQRATWQDIYEGWDSVMNEYFLSGIKGADTVKARQLWADAAAQSAAKGSTAAGPTNLPDWVLAGMEKVTGNRQVGGAFSRGTNAISQSLFQGPVDYRRGFLAEWVRQSEGARLQRLFDSQGRRIVDDAELVSIIHRRYPGLADEYVLRNLDTVTKQLRENHGVISRRYIDQLIESKVINEMDNMLYSFHMTSRAGRASKAVVPFGKPWADMWGYWSRELLSRPQLRGYLNNTNFLGISKAANAVADALPFNPKVAAFGSRLAATDFSMENIEDDPLVGGVARAIGLDGLDAGSALFLPVGGENPFSVMLPGFGLVPAAVASMLVTATAPDINTDPTAYQAHIDKYAQLFPSVAYNHPDSVASAATSSFLGGGVANRALNLANSMGQMFSGETPGPGVLSQDWKARVQALRQVKLLFQDPEVFAELAELPPELAEAGISAFLDEKLQEIAASGIQQAGRQGVAESLMEFGFAVRADFSEENDMLAEAWINNADFLGFEVPGWFDLTTERGRLEGADWVRGQFYDLPDWERDAAVAEQTGLAVNMVSMWEWSQKAKDAATVGSGVPYRTGGSMEDLDRHDALIQNGLIQPVSPRDMATRIAGTVLSARTQTARNLYVEASQTINDQRWEYLLNEEQRGWFDEMAAWLSENDALPYRTGRELWENKADLKRYYDEFYPPDEDGEGGFRLPDKLSAWGARMPSSREAVPERLDISDDLPEGYPLPVVTAQMARMAGALGMEMRPGMGMPEVYQMVADALSENYTDNPIFAHIGPEYQAWIKPRSAGHESAMATLNTVIDHRDFNPETVDQYKQTLVWLEETVARRAMDDPSWLDMREETVAMWSRMAQDDAFGLLDLNKLWDDAYGKSLGALDWEADEPSPLRMEDGEYNPQATQIFVNKVIDGDTIEVEYRSNVPSIFQPAMETYRIRMLGTNQPELGTDEGEAARTDLLTRINTALEEGTPITLVRDPDRYGYADMYGRVYGWVYIGDEAEYAPDTMIPRR